VAVKASGLPEYSEVPPPHADIGPRVRRVFEAFGPDRLFFGTDLTRQEGGYPALLALFDSFDWLRGEDRRKVMGDALADWLRWDRAPR
jgi:predicted TIM-barrel fold metal-dependent hydrolase